MVYGIRISGFAREGIDLTDFLLRIFMRKKDRTDQAGIRTAYGMLGSVAGILCNALLVAIKMIAGSLTGSMAVLADGFNNLSDMASSVISLLGVRAASKPADQKHPFGHGRAEYIAALVVSFAIINVGIELFREAIGRILHPSALVMENVALILLLFSVAVKLWMFFFNRNLSRRIHSDVMQATAMDSLFDAVTTSVTIGSLLFYKFSGINIDGFMSLVVSVIVIWAGIRITRDALSPLIGSEMDPETAKKITEIVRENSAVLGTHDLIIHNYGPTCMMATIHMEVPGSMTLENAHAIADQAEKKALHELGIILVVHVDPTNAEDERVIRIREKLKRILGILDPELSFHDLQVRFEEKENVISFDLEVPYKYSKEEESKVVQQIRSLIGEMNRADHCVINVDRGILEDTRVSG